MRFLYSLRGGAAYNRHYNQYIYCLIVQVSDDRCHYMIDLDIGTSSQREPNYSRDESRWEVIHSVPFLDSSRYEW